jgi:hypothetical protein
MILLTGTQIHFYDFVRARRRHDYLKPAGTVPAKRPESSWEGIRGAKTFEE